MTTSKQNNSYHASQVFTSYQKDKTWEETPRVYLISDLQWPLHLASFVTMDRFLQVSHLWNEDDPSYPKKSSCREVGFVDPKYRRRTGVLWNGQAHSPVSMCVLSMWSPGTWWSCWPFLPLLHSKPRSSSKAEGGILYHSRLERAWLYA